MKITLALLIPMVSVTARTPDAAAIIAKSVAVTQQDWNNAPKYSFIDREVQGKRGNIQPGKTYEVLMIDGSPYNKLLAVGSVPLSKQKQAAEQQKLEAETNKREHESAAERDQRVAKYLRERKQDHRMLTEMISAFDYTLVGEATVDGRKVWVLKASPKPGYVPHNREGKMLQRMRGTLWVDQATYQWVKVQADVVQPVSMYGFIAKVKPGTRFELEQAPVSGAVWMPKQFSVVVKAKALGIRNENSRDEDTYSSYKRMMPPKSSQLSAAK